MRTFPVPGVQALLCYHDLPGDEPTIVFLHGLGAASSEEFMQTVRYPLLAGFRMLLVDFLGFGFSERPLEYGYTMEDHADCVAQLLRQLQVDSAHVVGHSMGGSVAIALAMRHPDLVRNLVVAEGNLDPGIGTASARIAAWSEEDYIRDGHRAFVGEFARMVADAPGYGGIVRTMALASPHAMHRSARSLLAERTPTFREGLKHLPIPRTYLIGSRSLSEYPDRMVGANESWWHPRPHVTRPRPAASSGNQQYEDAEHPLRHLRRPQRDGHSGCVLQRHRSGHC